MASKALAPVHPRETWTHHRSIRIEDADWEALDTAAAEYGGRATVVRRMIKLFLATDENPVLNADGVTTTGNHQGSRTRAAVARMPDAIHTGGDYRSPEAKAARQ